MKNLYLELIDKGIDVTVLTLEPRYPNKEMYKDEKFWNENGINEKDVIRIDTFIQNHGTNIFKRLILYFEVMIRFILKILLLKNEYNYIFVTSPPIFVGVAGLIAKWKLRVPFILDIRDLWPESLTGVKLFSNKFILNCAYKIEEILYKQSTRIIINSKSFLDYMTNKGVPKEKIKFLPNSLTEEELNFTSDLQNNDDMIDVIYTGNLGLAQDIQKLIDLAILLKEDPKIRFTIIGYGYHLNKLEEIINERKLSNLKLLSAKSRKETLSIVSQADIAYVSLVKQEVFKTVLPGKIIDYMSVRKPIIGDVEGYAKGIIESANCGIVTKDSSLEELVKNIKKLADNPELRKELGENGYQYAYQNLRWKTNIDVLINTMEDIDE
jgi:glycosyltransferase involved in cell wall biosynthesis